ncbi:putative odorant receptor 92a [Cochliomyia hominivorax]
MFWFKRPPGLLSLRSFVIVPFKFYSVVGIKLFQWDEHDVMTIWEKIAFVVTISNLLLNFICKSTYFIFDEFENAVHMTKWSLYLAFSMNGFCKMFSVAMGRKTLLKVLKDLEHLFPRTAKERQNFKVSQGYEFIIQHLKIMVYSHWSITIMFIIFPIVQSTVEYIKTGIFIARTPYIMTYPFDVSHDWPFIFAYGSQVLGGLSISCYFVASDTLLLSTIYLVILQFQYLCFRITNFKAQNFEKDIKELKDILEKHCRLNDFAQRVNNVFSLSILLNYIISIMVIVFIGVQIFSVSDLLDITKFMGFFTSATVQVYYVCMFGTILKKNSSLVGESFMGQEWYNADVRYQRILIMAIARSQRPAHLTAFKFFTISMESFSNLMTTSYQFFTLLKTRMEEGNI